MVGGEEPLTVAAPERPDPTDVLGPGQAANIHWADQGDTNYCGLYSVRAIVSELYGQQLDVAEMVNRATANGWFVYDDAGRVKGIRPADIDDVLASYGVGSRNFGGPEAAAVSDPRGVAGSETTRWSTTSVWSSASTARSSIQLRNVGERESTWTTSWSSPAWTTGAES